VDNSKVRRRSSSTNGVLNYGHRLYQKGLKKKEEHERAIKEAKKLKKINEDKAYTFKPEIDHNSKIMTKDLSKDKAENRLIMFGQILQEKKEQQRTVMAIEDKLKCTFHPELNKMYLFRDKSRSEKLASELNNNISVEWGGKQENIMAESKFEFLFEDAKRRQKYQQRVQEINPDKECTFQPNIYTSKRPLMSQSKLLTSKAETPLSQISQNTGQEFFRPKIGRPPKNNRNIACLPIGDYLYAQNKKKENIQPIDDHKVKECNVHSKKMSNQIIEDKKTEIFKDVFNLLDRDGDGVISAKTANVTSKKCVNNRITTRNA